MIAPCGNPPHIVGSFQLLASDNFDLDPLIYIKGSAGSFVAGCFTTAIKSRSPMVPP
jgi:hypothetical protein